MLGWKKHKLESRLLGEISITSYIADDTILMAESEELKSLLMKVKENEKVGFKLNIWKTKIMASGSHHFMGNRWGNNENSDRLYLGDAPKLLQMVTAAMNLKDTCSLEEKL